MDDVIFRPATIDDADAIGHLHSESWRVAFAHLFSTEICDHVSEERRAKWRENFTKPWFQRTRVTLAERGDELLGFVHFGPDRDSTTHSEIYSLYVEPSAWRLGIGMRLVRSAQDELRDQGFHYVLGWHHPENARVRAMLVKLGCRLPGNTRDEVLPDGTTASLYMSEFALRP